MAKQRYDLNPEFIGQAIKSRVLIGKDQKFLGLQLAIRPADKNVEQPFAIEVLMEQKVAMNLLSNLQKIQKLYDLPVPEGVQKMDKVT